MLDLGFEKDIRRIISQIPPKDKRHTLMFSATWPQSIQNLANEFLNDPVKVTIGSEGKFTTSFFSNLYKDLSANHRVTQIVEVVSPFDKDKRLEALLKEYHKSRKNRILIFALYKKEASR